MIIDTSAIVAVFLKEPGFETILEKLLRARGMGVGAPTLVEAGIVLRARARLNAVPELVRFVQEVGIAVVPFGDLHWREAVEAYARFGKGRHPAALNFGDCLAYAVAKLASQPLLCTGEDFSRTDLELA